ncbi:hypothetical protein S7711_08432 [Stachybotrys chartarum IBT 7711]|uniref:Uncharacterized protein n=1 Tax=Stachybotrys chartarum (strain CBS 109288 / IBT 7711) TaxID=1280523 RepID=A0A084BAT7_STACB|nr:hypothetical protein S7711_08432 [Stachybotrys chartarum IBT 7711]
MAKDCDLNDAIQLCRNWKEFSDLSHLTNPQFSPAANWISWGAERTVSQLQELEFFPYFFDFEAQERNRHHQIGGRGHGQAASSPQPPLRPALDLSRQKGLGRASKNEWVSILEVGPAYFAMTDKLRKRKFDFDYYDVFI